MGLFVLIQACQVEVRLIRNGVDLGDFVVASSNLSRVKFPQHQETKCSSPFSGAMASLSNANSRRMYSWWWDSHISPKNSKWLQENLTGNAFYLFAAFGSNSVKHIWMPR
ncbi:Protein NETWORKED 1D, partial [Mucuna pruriens]